MQMSGDRDETLEAMPSAEKDDIHTNKNFILSTSNIDTGESLCYDFFWSHNFPLDAAFHSLDVEE